MRHFNSFTTVTETIAEYRKRIQQMDRDWEYQKSIRCSVPVKSIAVSSTELTTENRWEPG
jgi:hypothetical protein